MHVEFEPYHRSENPARTPASGREQPRRGADRSQQSLPDPGRTALAARHGEFHFSRCDPAQWQTELAR